MSVSVCVCESMHKCVCVLALISVVIQRSENLELTKINMT